MACVIFLRVCEFPADLSAGMKNAIRPRPVGTFANSPPIYRRVRWRESRLIPYSRRFGFPPMNRRAIRGRPYGTSGSLLEFRQRLRDALFSLSPENDAEYFNNDTAPEENQSGRL